MSDLQMKRMARLEKHFQNLESGLEEFEAMVKEKLPALGIELQPVRKTSTPSSAPNTHSKRSSVEENLAEKNLVEEKPVKKIRRSKPR